MSRTKTRGRKLAPLLWILVCLLMFAWTASASTSAPSTSKTTLHTVQSGETVWSISEHINSSGLYDTRQVEDEIYSLNHLSGQAYLTPGTKLIVPAGGN